MSFNNEVKKHFLSLLERRGLDLKEEFAGSITFCNENISITFVSDVKADEINIFLGYRCEDFELDGIDFTFILQIISLPQELRSYSQATEDRLNWYKKVIQLYPEILNGDRDFLIKLDRHYKASVSDYNFRLKKKLLDIQADRAWDQKDYEKFIRLLDPIKTQLNAREKRKLLLAKRFTGN